MASYLQLGLIRQTTKSAGEGDGLIVIRAKTLGEANAIAARDPMHARGPVDIGCVPG
jgi:hypothetical protein